MNIFTYITQSELDNLPDDPQRAFIELVRICQTRFLDLEPSEVSDQETYDRQKRLRYSYMGIILAASQQYDIEPFASMVVTKFRDFDDNDFEQFRNDLDFFVTKQVLTNNSKSKRESILITPELKDSLHTYVSGLRKALEEANDIDDRKRKTLLEKLDEFELELEKKRLSLLSVAIIAITILGAPGSLGSSAEMAHKLFSNIFQQVHNAKAADERAMLPIINEPLKIAGPNASNSNVVAKSDRLPTSPPISSSKKPQ